MSPAADAPSYIAAYSASLHACIELEQAEVALATKRNALAEETCRVAETRFIAAEEAYFIQKAARDDARAYLTHSRRHLAASAERLAQAKAALLPVSSMPVTALRLIFQACLLPPPTELGFDTDCQFYRQQFYLAAVCRRWRHAILTCPEAWTVLKVDLDAVTESQSASRVFMAYISCVLTRSADAALTICVTRQMDNDDCVAGHVALLVGAVHRCRSLFITAPRMYHDNDALAPLLTTTTPMLESLHLITCDGDANSYRDTDDSLELDIFPVAPRLRRLRIVYPVLGKNWPKRFPAVDYVEFYGSCEEADLWTLVMACPNASTLSIANFVPSGCNLSEDDWPSCEPADSVRILRIAQNDGELAPLARYWSFPHTHTLELRGNPSTGRDRLAYLHTFGGDAHALQNVLVEGLFPNGFRALLNALPALPVLQVLTVEHAHISAAGLAQLCTALGRPSSSDASTGEENWLCPHLTSLALLLCTLKAGCAEEKFVELARGRLRAAAHEERPHRPKRLTTFVLPAGSRDEIVNRVSELLADE